MLKSQPKAIEINKNYQITNPEIMESKDILALLGSSHAGLCQSDVDSRLIEIGYNEIPEQKQTSPFILFLNQFRSFIVLILGGAVLLSFFNNHAIDAIIILVIILANALIGFFQEYRAAKSIQALKKMLQPTAKVLRNGESIIIPSREIVPGDILELEEGDKIGADARLIFGRNFQTVESSLTGESLPVTKSSITLTHPQLSIADKTNLVFMGTLVATGHAQAVVIATGKNTAFGSIANLLDKVDEKKSHFKEKTDTLAKQLAFGSIIASVAIFLIGYFIQKIPLTEMILTTTAILVSAIPEGLPAILAVSLSVGARKMAKNNAIIRDLPSVETLGVLDIICTDKTGTLTQNTMTAKNIFVPNLGYIEVDGQGWESTGNFYLNNKVIDPKTYLNLERLLFTCTMGNKAKVEYDHQSHSYTIIGDPTEAGLVVVAQKATYDRKTLCEDWTYLDDLTFSSTNKYRATLIQNSDNQTEKYILVTGAPEVILEKCNLIYSTNGETISKSQTVDQNASDAIEKYTDLGYRTIGLALKKVSDSKTEIDHKVDIEDLIFLGIVGIQDPIRQEVKNAIAKAKEAGIRIIVLTGDHKKTAATIAKEIGLLSDTDVLSNTVLEEKEFLELNQEEREKIMDTVVVLARLNPQTKLLITDMLQKKGHSVAMTGDGVNDAPALKQADIGISMGKIGTDVARESSKMVLVDDNFTSIILAIEEGRNIFQNIRKVSHFLLTTSLAEIAIFLISFCFGLGSLLSATQILWLNLVTDGLNGLALAVDPAEDNLMKQKPQNINTNILNKRVLPFLLIGIGTMVPATIAAYFSFADLGLLKATSATFFVLSLSQIFSLFCIKSLDRSVFTNKFFNNKFLIATALASSALIILTPYTFLAKFLGLVGFNFWQTVYLIFLSSLVLWVTELYKFVLSRS